MDLSLLSVSLQQINVFINVVEANGFAKASLSLMMTQSAVSKSIAKLEQALGITLFHRTTRELNLTDAGKLLYEEWKPMMASLNSSYFRAKSIQNKSSQNILIGLMNTARPEKYLRDFYSSFNLKYPDISVEFDSLYFEDLITEFIDGKYDAIMIPDFERYTVEEFGMKWKWVACSDAQVIVPRSNPLSERKFLTTPDIINENFSMVTDKHKSASFFKDLSSRFEPYGAVPKVPHHYKSAYNVLYNLNLTDNLMLIDSFFDYRENQITVLLPLVDQINGIICAWNPKRESLPLRKFLSFFTETPEDYKQSLIGKE